jgi:endonuclease/exonuclease/phosphatase family metal-dependent hydrolase
MRSIPDFDVVPPHQVVDDFNNLRIALNAIPPKKENNLLLATFNICRFGSLSKQWRSVKSPRRDFTAMQTIAEIISRFDVIAIQEVCGDLRALRYLMNMLGSYWGFLMTDITLGDVGNAERLAYIYDRTRVSPSGLACELVIPPEYTKKLQPDTLTNQFARTPYAVSFKRKSATFILVTVHVIYGKSNKDRKGELQAIADWMHDWAERENKWHHNFFVLGDFNINKRYGELWDIFSSTGLSVPACLQELPRTIYDDPNNPDENSYYDQIAWFKANGDDLISMRLSDGGNFDFMPYAYSDLSLSKRSTQFRLSDHYPLWCEFTI